MARPNPATGCQGPGGSPSSQSAAMPAATAPRAAGRAAAQRAVARRPCGPAGRGPAASRRSPRRPRPLPPGRRHQQAGRFGQHPGRPQHVAGEASDPAAGQHRPRQWRRPPRPRRWPGRAPAASRRAAARPAAPRPPARTPIGAVPPVRSGHRPGRPGPARSHRGRRAGHGPMTAMPVRDRHQSPASSRIPGRRALRAAQRSRSTTASDGEAERPDTRFGHDRQPAVRVPAAPAARQRCRPGRRSAACP